MTGKFDDRRVRYLCEAVMAGSVRAAADKLDMNPSVVSRQIMQLEAELAMPLMERHGRGVKATDAGRMLVDYYRQHISHQDDVLGKLQGLKGLSRGHIDVILGEGFVSDLMAWPLQDFWSRYPALTLSLNLAGTNEVLRRVADDAAHIGLVYNPPVTAGIRSRAVIKQPMCVITRPDHPLMTMQRQPLLKHIVQYPIALMHGSYGTRQMVELAERIEKVSLSPKLTTDSISIIKQFVKGGLGLALLPAFAVSQEVAAGELVALPVDNRIMTAAEAHIVTRLGRQLSPAANQLLLQLISTMEAFRDPGRERPATRPPNR